MRINQARTTIVVLIVSIGLLPLAPTSLHAGEHNAGLPSDEFSLTLGRSSVVTVPASPAARLCSVLISLKQPGRIAPWHIDYRQHPADQPASGRRLDHDKDVASGRSRRRSGRFVNRKTFRFRSPSRRRRQRI